MFPPRWFTSWYWANRYFPKMGAQPANLPAPSWRCYTPSEETRTYTA